MSKKIKWYLEQLEVHRSKHATYQSIEKWLSFAAAIGVEESNLKVGNVGYSTEPGMLQEIKTKTAAWPGQADRTNTRETIEKHHVRRENQDPYSQGGFPLGEIFRAKRNSFVQIQNNSD